PSMTPLSQYAGMVLSPATPPLLVSVDGLAPPTPLPSTGENPNSGELHAVATKNVPATAAATTLNIPSTRRYGTVGRYHTELSAAMGALGELRRLAAGSPNVVRFASLGLRVAGALARFGC